MQSSYPGYPPQPGFGPTATLQPPAGQFPGAPGYGQQQSYATPQASPYGAPPSPYGASPHSPYPGQMAPSPYPGAVPQFPYGQQPYGTASPYPGYGQFPPTMPSLGYGPAQTIMYDPRADAYALRAAMKGFGTNEKELIRVLSNKDPLQINAIRDCYNLELRRDLITDLEKETSGWFEYGLVALARGPLLNDVYMALDAIKGMGTNEALLNDVVLGRSNADLNAIKQTYAAIHGRDMVVDILGDLSMKTKRHFDMVLAARRAEDSEPVDPARVAADVDSMYLATEGQIGTDELKVAEILTYRNDNQIRAISQAYNDRYRRSLSEVITKEFSGHMQEALLFQLHHAEDKYMHAAKLLEEAMTGLGTNNKLLVSRVVRYHWNQDEVNNIKGAYQNLMGIRLANRIINETSRDQRRLLLACLAEVWG